MRLKKITTMIAVFMMAGALLIMGAGVVRADSQYDKGNYKVDLSEGRVTVEDHLQDHETHLQKGRFQGFQRSLFKSIGQSSEEGKEGL